MNSANSTARKTIPWFWGYRFIIEENGICKSKPYCYKTAATDSNDVIGGEMK